MRDLFVRLVLIVVLVLLQLDSGSPAETALPALLPLLLPKSFLVVTLQSLRIFLFLMILIILGILNIADLLIESLILHLLFEIDGIEIHDLIFKFP